MPRQRNRYSRRTYVLPEDFPQRLKLFQGESGLSWSEVARLIGTYRHTVWRCAEGTVRPNYRRWRAVLELADSLDLGHLFTDREGPMRRRVAEVHHRAAGESAGKAGRLPRQVCEWGAQTGLHGGGPHMGGRGWRGNGRCDLRAAQGCPADCRGGDRDRPGEQRRHHVDNFG